MNAMKEIFLQLTTSNEMLLMGKFIFIPLVTLVSYYLLLMLFIRLRFFKDQDVLDNFYLNFQFSKIFAINTSTLLLNGYWYYLLYNNSMTHIEWGFVFDLVNIYLQLAPFIIANVILIFIYSKTKKSILNIL